MNNSYVSIPPSGQGSCSVPCAHVALCPLLQTALAMHCHMSMYTSLPKGGQLPRSGPVPAVSLIPWLIPQFSSLYFCPQKVLAHELLSQVLFVRNLHGHAASALQSAWSRAEAHTLHGELASSS